MYSKFFRISMLVLFGAFLACRMFISTGWINDIVLSAALLLFFVLAGGGLLFDKKAEEGDRRAYRNFTIAFGVILLVWGILLLLRYVIL